MHNRVDQFDEAAATESGLAAAEADRIDIVKVISATKARDRAALGEAVTAWMADNPNVRILKTVVVQSSDKEFHCLSIVLFGVVDTP